MGEAIRPVRLRLSRAKGFDLQRLSRETNGLPAVVVARPTRWGNPWRVGDYVPHRRKSAGGMTQTEAVDRFRRTAGALDSGLIARHLRGRNLACWCALDAPCHADVLLEMANRPACDAPEGSAAA